MDIWQFFSGHTDCQLHEVIVWVFEQIEMDKMIWNEKYEQK